MINKSIIKSKYSRIYRISFLGIISVSMQLTATGDGSRISFVLSVLRLGVSIGFDFYEKAILDE